MLVLTQAEAASIARVRACLQAEVATQTMAGLWREWDESLAGLEAAAGVAAGVVRARGVKEVLPATCGNEVAQPPAGRLQLESVIVGSPS